MSVQKFLRKIVNIPFVNSIVRGIVKGYAVRSRLVANTMMRYIQVSGKIQVDIGKHHFILWGSGDDALVSKLYYNIGWEKNVISWFSKFCMAYNSIIDAGANIGIFSLLAAKDNPNAIIHAFEPNPYNHKRLKRNIALNDLQQQIHVHELALGNSIGHITFYLPADDRISDVSSVYAAHAKSFNDFKHQSIEVPCTTLDAFCSANDIFPRLIKMDVELYELQVMLGMKHLLTSFRPFIFVEIFNDEVKRKLNPALDAELEKGYTTRVEEFLRSQDYHFYLMVPSGILFVDSLKYSPLSTMYLLLPVKLKQAFYLTEEAGIVLTELKLWLKS